MPDLIRYPFSDAGVEQAVKALGDSPDAVATTLLALGFQGCKGSASNCPIANYVLAVVEGAETAHVGWAYDDSLYIRVTRQAFPSVADAEGFPAASRFVDLFDQGDYPDLKGDARAA